MGFYKGTFHCVCFFRSSLLNKVVGSDTCLTTPAALRAYGTVLSIGSSAPPDMASFASSIMGQLPNPVRSVIDNWLHGNTFDFPTPGAWVSGNTLYSNYSSLNNFDSLRDLLIM